MHKPRLLGWQDTCVYHVVSRTAGREFLFEAPEREMFGRMLEKSARFCGAEILTWCCLSNHFHLLVRISKSSTAELCDRLRSDRGAFLEHLGILYTQAEVSEIAAQLEHLMASGGDADANAMIERYLLRIGDVSVFVKELKQRFSIWYNQRHDRDGALWNGRFRSVLVENRPMVLRTVASYIDLNPVRAGLVVDPKDYRWCGYAQALGGVKSARAGLRAVIARMEGGGGEAEAEDSQVRDGPWRNVAEDYRVLLFGRAAAVDDGAGGVLRKGAGAGAVARVLAEGGKLPAHELFRIRVRHLTAGTALGSSAFLTELTGQRPDLVGKRRKTAARPIRQLDAGGLCSLRDLGSVD